MPNPVRQIRPAKVKPRLAKVKAPSGKFSFIHSPVDNPSLTQ
ncbi:Uncharacterized protein dnm_059640 [Desulfonema magnum]|uniref:Uncharacterized protein n=1 Tax=Desulfonema magnum TaxID=45655 RepID=A0A975BRU4_9BACT|nr:Uncharacterized protein dnm_059640 [Desulfonema magnum]